MAENESGEKIELKHFPKKSSLINVQPLRDNESSNIIPDRYQNNINKDLHILSQHVNAQNNLNSKEKLNLLPGYSQTIQKNISLSFNPNLSTPTLTLGQLSLEPTTHIDADNIGEFVFPLVQYIAQTEPDYIVACDRGARLIALATHMLYQELFGEMPTKDHKIHLRRISKSNKPEETKEHLRPLISDMVRETERPKVLILDDWISLGITKGMIKQIFGDLTGNRAELLFGVLKGSGADIAGIEDDWAMADWHDDPTKIGVTYEGFEVKPDHKPTALEYRRKMQQSIRTFAKKIKAESMAPKRELVQV